MKKVFITGATGFIGYHLLCELLYNNVEVWVLCREESKDFNVIKKIKGIHIVACNLENVFQVSQMCSERKFDAFYHLAWEGASGALRNDYNTQIQNVKWTCDCIETAKKLECKKIVITGTVCERQCDELIKRNALVGSSYYLLAKKYANAMALTLCRKLNLPLIWCQFYHPIGVYNKKEQLIANTIHKLLNHEKLQFGSAQGLFDAIDVRDLAHALYFMGEKKLKNTMYFVGSGNAQRLKDYLEILKGMIDPSAQMEYGALKTTELPMEKEWLDAAAFNEETGFKPLITFEESVISMRKWMENEEKYDSEKWLI